MTTYIGECGHQVSDFGVKTCQQCRHARGYHPCAVCGEPVKKRYRACRKCYDNARNKPRRQCAGCNKPVLEPVNQWCRPCYEQHRRDRPPRLCTRDGCNRKHTAKGLCNTHYILTYAKNRNGTSPNTRLKYRLGNWPCQVCGYGKMRSHVHRIIPKGIYHPPNIVAVCVRCHAEIHRGLTPCPEPPTEDQIRTS